MLHFVARYDFIICVCFIVFQIQTCEHLVLLDSLCNRPSTHFKSTKSKHFCQFRPSLNSQNHHPNDFFLLSAWNVKWLWQLWYNRLLALFPLCYMDPLPSQYFDHSHLNRTILLSGCLVFPLCYSIHSDREAKEKLYPLFPGNRKQEGRDLRLFQFSWGEGGILSYAIIFIPSFY